MNEIKSFEEFCKEKNKLELLALYDNKNNKEKPSEVYFSGTKKYFFKCPVCKNKWQGKMNKINRLSKGDYNVIKKRKEITYCPYCKGTRVSTKYNLATEYPGIIDYWDYDRNDFLPTSILPKSQKRFFLKCKNNYCNYKAPHSKMIKDFVNGMEKYKCPKCSKGINTFVDRWNNLKYKFPDLIQEWDYGRNNKNPEEYLPTSIDKVWWKCRKNHRYLCRISNKTFLNRGCPICYSQHKTSFVEQAIYFYIKKCFFDAENRVFDNYTKKEIDIFIPSKSIAIEVSSKYFHQTITDKMLSKDIDKLLSLANYYKVYSIQEYDNQIDHALIKQIKLPVFIHSKKCYEIYNEAIYKLLKELNPDCITYPNINIERDMIDILNSYIKNDVDSSFEDVYPIYAQDWDYNKNGNLTPSMFKYSNSQFKFYWICSNCGKSYKMSMNNRVKLKEQTCSYCSIGGEKPNSINSLASRYPMLIPYWHPNFNDCDINEVRSGSEKIAIFMLSDKRCVPVRICNITMALKKDINMNIDVYLEGVLKRINTKKLTQKN